MLEARREMTYEEVRRFLKRYGVKPLPPEEHERQELAVQRLKERFSGTSYEKRFSETGWRNFQGSAALAD